MRDSLRALVYRPGSLGDTLLSLPAVARIHRDFPQHRLTLLTERATLGRVSPWTILQQTGWFDDVHFYVVKAASVADRWHNLALAKQLRKVGYDEIFALAPPRTARQLRVDSFIFRNVVGSAHYHAARTPSWPIAATAARADVEHEALRLLRIVDPGATGDALGDFRLIVPDTERSATRALLSELGVQPDDVLVGVGPGSSRAATTWPAQRFAAVGSALLQQFRNVVLLGIGGSSERTLCDELCRAWGPRSHNLAGRLSVLGSAAMLSQCTTFIGNDSGPMHLAASVGVPCVAIFSARNAAGQWEPLGRHHVVLEERPECAGCMLDDCVQEANKCLTRIPTGRVVREAVSLIESRAACLAI